MSFLIEERLIGLKFYFSKEMIEAAETRFSDQHKILFLKALRFCFNKEVIEAVVTWFVDQMTSFS